MKTTLRITGMKELQARLRAMENEALSVKVLAAAAAQAFEPVLRDARAKVPKDTGLLHDSLEITVKKNPKDSDAVLRVGLKVATGKGGGRADVRRAAQAAYMAGKDAKGILRSKKNASRKSAHWRWHFVELGTAKMRATPFLRPALEKNSKQVLAAFKTALAIEIANAMRKRAA